MLDEIDDLVYLQNKLDNLDKERENLRKQISLLKDAKNKEEFAYLFSLDWTKEIDKAAFIRDGVHYRLYLKFDENSQFYNQYYGYLRTNNKNCLFTAGYMVYEWIYNGYNFAYNTSSFDAFKNFVDRLDCYIETDKSTREQLVKDMYVLNKNIAWLDKNGKLNLTIKGE